MPVVHRRLIAVATLPVGAAVVAALVTVVPVVVPVLLVAALATLVRLGDTVLDRVMVALALGTGLFVTAALGFSLWPWGLDPLPVSLTAWVGLWLLAVATGRRPTLPRWSVVDLALPVSAAFAMLPLWRVLAVDGLVGRLALVMLGEDNSRHFVWWAGIRDSGTYLFLAGDRFPESVVTGTGYYPQGWHVIAAVLDRFAGRQGGLADVDRYLTWTLVTQAFLVLNVVWLAMVTARAVGALHVVAAAVVAGALVTGGELFRPMIAGYPGQSLGLSMAVAAAAVAVLSSRREPSATSREPMLVLAATVVATSFSYYVLLPAIGLFVAVWLWRRRRSVRLTPVTLVVTALVTAALSAVMPLLGVRKAVGDGALQVAGSSGPVWVSLIVLGGLGAAGLVLTGAWREPAFRWILVAGACFFGFGAVLAVAFQSGYYVHKIWYVPIATSAAICAGLVLRIPSLAGREGRFRTTVALVAVAAASVVGSGLTSWGSGLVTNNSVGTSSYGVWRSDFYLQPASAQAVLDVLDAPAAPRATTFVVDLNPYAGYGIDLFSSALDGTSDELSRVHYVTTFEPSERLEEQLEAADGRVRLLATSMDAAVFAKGIVDQTGQADRVRIVVLGEDADKTG